MDPIQVLGTVIDAIELCKSTQKQSKTLGIMASSHAQQRAQVYWQSAKKLDPGDSTLFLPKSKRSDDRTVKRVVRVETSKIICFNETPKLTDMPCNVQLVIHNKKLYSVTASFLRNDSAILMVARVTATISCIGIGD